MIIVIPFYKNSEQLEKCKEAITNQASFVDTTIVVNDSDTGNGFTASCNEGLRKAFKVAKEHGTLDGLVLVLNQDCYLQDGALRKMVEFMDSHPRCAIAGIKQLSSQNKDHIIHGGTYECFPTGRHEGGRVSKGDCSVSKQVPWVNGACMIVRMEALLEIGLMDPNYKMFGSDADWGYTARQRGWETWYIAEAVCVHEQGASKTQDEKMARVFDADMNYFAGKWLGDDQFRELSMEVFT